jgi:acyl carrier protein
MTTVDECVARLACEYFHVAPARIGPLTRLRDHLEADDHEVFDFAAEIEALFDIVFDDRELAQVITLGDLSQLVKNAIANRNEVA